MNPFKNSLINKIQFLGLIVFLLIGLILFFTYKATIIYDRRTQIHNAIEIHNLLNFDKDKLQNYLDLNGIITISKEKALQELKSSSELIEDTLILSVIKDSGIRVYMSNEHILFFLKKDLTIFYFMSDKNTISTKSLKLSLYSILLFLFLYSIFYYIRSALSPLIRLNKNIEKFSKCEDIEINYESANDEIANVANAFYKAVEYNEKLKSQRDMFVRTIMHEVKTSLTKARFITHFMPDGEEEKIKLNALICSMQEELDKLNEFESVNTKILQIKLSKYSLNTLLADVCDVLLLEDSEIEIDEESVSVEFDYTLFMVVIKNLIDNAIKYSKDKHVEVYIKEQYIEIRNLATTDRALDIERLSKPFKQEDESSSGMGLGLYLINEIINKHEFKLEYTFTNNYHSFKVLF